MIFLLIAGLSVGIEGGINQPVAGLEDLNSGVVFRVFAGKPTGFVNTMIAIESSFHGGENPGYGISTYGLRLVFIKAGWRLSPLAEFGFDHLSRSLNNSSETGIVFDYTIGFLLAFRAQSIRIFPKFYYSGITDYEKHAGFLGMKLGIGYDF